jgi:hypothetical protein
MGTRFLLGMACAVTVAACGGSDGANTDRPAQSGRTSGPAAQQITLAGCVQTGPSNAGLVLEDVQVERSGSAPNRPEGQPQSDPAASTAAFTPGAWVRLSSQSVRDLEQYVGQRVNVHGSMVDSGASTIGTTGAQGEPSHAGGDKSRAAVPGHQSDRVRDEAGPIGQTSMANGRAPEFQVQSLSSTGVRCGESTPPR